MSSFAIELLVQPDDLSSWVRNIKQLIEQGELAHAQQLVDAFQLCHPSEVWPHILKAWLATEAHTPLTALAETELVITSSLYARLASDEQEFVQALRRRSQMALRDQEQTSKQQPQQNHLSGLPTQENRIDDYAEILPRRAVKIKKIAFYLPQFHPIPENNEWWGEGFTEWNNVSRAQPLFTGHWQPRRPGPMGFYDLRVPATMNKQFKLAQAYGIDGFCFYYYWFNGKKLLEEPLEMLIAEKTDPFPFCICWVNETWTRSWDGMSGEVLIEANQSLEGTMAFIRDLEPVLKNKNYIRVDGRPLILVYCAQKLEQPEKTVQDWRHFSRTAGIGELHICAVQSFGFDDPTCWGFDAGVEFPPHCVPHKHEGLSYCRDLSQQEIDQLNVAPSFTGEIRDYEYFARCGMARPKEPYLLYKGCMLAWDNTARRMESAHVYANFSVKIFQDWLAACIDYCCRDNLNQNSDSFVFINAWNEWAEGCTLEPDQHFGYALLNASLAASEQAKWIEPFTHYKQGLPLGLHLSFKHQNVLVFGHDAHMHGAQVNLLSMVKNLVKKMGNKVHVILLIGGELVDSYKKLAPTTVISDDLSGDLVRLAELIGDLRARGFSHAILNTTVTGNYTKLSKDYGFTVSNLIHELPSLIKSCQLEERLYEIAKHSDDIVFSSSYVRDKIKAEFGLPLPNSRILPQGINFNSRYPIKGSVRDRLRDAKGIRSDELVVMSCGFADFRKGIDVFVRVAQNVINQISSARFIWVGRIDPTIESYVRSDIANMGLEDKILITGNLPLPFDYYLSSDIFLLTSREDPLPSVVMEAFDAGLPVVAFEGAGGFVELLDDGDRGVLVPYMNEALMSEAILVIKSRLERGDSFEQNHDFARANFDYVNYLQRVLQLTSPTSKKPLEITANPITVSAIIPNYNYKRYLGGRISSVINQTKSVEEIIFLDDCSCDGSLDYASSLLDKTGIPVRVIANKANTGIVAAQWKRGVDAANSQYVWIAEADDYCEPTLNEDLSAHASANAAYDLSIVYCQSYMTDSLGTVGSTYFEYYAGIKSIYGEIFAADFVLGGVDFIANYLGITNVIPNSSACLLSQSKIAALDWSELMQYKYSADWITYLRLANLGTIAYLSKPLNYHRRHSQSVVNQNLDKPRGIYQEAATIQELALSLIIHDLPLREKLKEKSYHWLQSAFSEVINS